jgi:hypothetical protein
MRRSGIILGRQISKYITNEYYRESTRIRVYDKNLLIIPRIASDKENIFIWFYSETPLSHIVINNLTKRVDKNYGLLNIDPKEILGDKDKDISIRGIYMS